MTTNGTTHYDVVIAGGSYAGLAAAANLGERALIIDQHQIGAIQHSACAIPLDIAQRFDVEETVLQIYPDGYVHTVRGTTSFQLQPRYCIFDHQRLCQTLFARSGTQFLRARIQGLEGNTVLTSAGAVTGRVLIDATGWPAALATARQPALEDRERLTVAMEAEIPGEADGIHFYFDPDIVRHGYAWMFPAGDTLRIGVGSYIRQPGLTEALHRFLKFLGHQGKPRRGGMIPWFDRPPTVGNIFLAGDAAGHCVPLTAEGIRFALHFGDLAGRVAQEVVDGRLSLEAGLASYRLWVEAHRRRMKLMRFAQSLVGRMPNRGIDLAARMLTLPPVEPRFMERYARWTGTR
ncbi:MAG TPA: NAD(P)/FAD-dependent oxidoreductase [Nitrolancea sp.]|nr:NAD(P)/FAD-dependent oxidoreductase [Nitrolancea sp.]